MPNSATRLITLIMLLQSRPNQKASELAEQLGVSVRSVHRYLAMLEEIGIPIDVEVIAPAELRQMVRQWAQAIANTYDTEHKNGKA